MGARRNLLQEVSQWTKCEGKHFEFSEQYPSKSSSTIQASLPQAMLGGRTIKQTNKALGTSDKPLTYGELLLFIGLWFQMAMTHFKNRREFWSTKPVDPFQVLPGGLIHIWPVHGSNRFSTH